MFPFLFGNLQRSVITGVVALVLVGGAATKLYFAGRSAGAESTSRAMVEARDKERVTERSAFEETLRVEQTKVALAERRYMDAVALVSRLNSELDRARQETAFARLRVGKLSDDQLFADVRAQLGMVPPTDTTPFTAPELREIDVRVSEHPLLVKQNGILTQTIAAEEAKLAAKLDELKAVQSQRDSAILAFNQLTGHYTVAYNALRKRNWFLTIITAGIAGGPHKLSIPPPVGVPRP